jgi:hypothetical protein
LAIPAGLEVKAKPVVRNARPPANLKTVCDRVHNADSCEPVPDEIQEFVKSVVKMYLPGMENARLTMSLEHMGCEAQPPTGNTGQQSPRGHKQPESAAPRQGFQLARKVITLSKDVPNTAHIHHHYARLTLDAQGKLVKLVVSR